MGWLYTSLLLLLLFFFCLLYLNEQFIIGQPRIFLGKTYFASRAFTSTRISCSQRRSRLVLSGRSVSFTPLLHPSSFVFLKLDILKKLFFFFCLLYLNEQFMIGQPRIFLGKTYFASRAFTSTRISCSQRRSRLVLSGRSVSFTPLLHPSSFVSLKLDILKNWLRFGKENSRSYSSGTIKQI